MTCSPAKSRHFARWRTSGILEFIDSRQVGGLPPDLPAPVFAPKFQISPRSGMLLLFPSYLQHWVYPNQEETERVSIAFNARIISRKTAPVRVGAN